tara:strand:- start:468 stop:626 length:159 start_codon:yes stop_codon:yes gene_type:complete
MAIHIKDIQEVLNILRDVQTYIYVQHRNDDLGSRILTRIDEVLKDDDIPDTK